MLPSETTKIIIAARQIDRFVSSPDDIMVGIWGARFNAEEIGYEDAYKAVINTTSTTITMQSIIDAVKTANRRMPTQIAEDVRSARARGLVDSDWSEQTIVPSDVRERLADIRAQARATAIEFKEIA